jgi:hypothetical protein
MQPEKREPKRLPGVPRTATVESLQIERDGMTHLLPGNPQAESSRPEEIENGLPQERQ